MNRTPQRARAGTRSLAVLTVLLGLLAMHGLASNHHAAADTTAVPHGAAQRQPAAAPKHHQHAAVLGVVQDTTATATPAGPSGDDDCPDLPVLCVAVLAGAALLALLLGRRHAPLPSTEPQRDLEGGVPPGRFARPPDPVKELCVSRT